MSVSGARVIHCPPEADEHLRFTRFIRTFQVEKVLYIQDGSLAPTIQRFLKSFNGVNSGSKEFNTAVNAAP
jgi:hypothetical protein